MSLKSKIDEQKLPQHVAVIMDGNGRWAKEKGKFRIFGHQNGVKSVRETSEAAAELGIKYLTLYAFSTENWNRPQLEVIALMELLVSTIRKETNTLMKNNIRLHAIGNMEDLPTKCFKELNAAIEETKNNSRMTLILALSYSAKWDITNAVKTIAKKVESGSLLPNDITDKTIDEHLSTRGIPNPELMIRTSGEHRISNFLLWELAYSEFYFTNTLWPDFNRESLYEAILDYQQRERRFGKTSEQLAI
ncbi:MAG: isoprenyl transferase [Bacteroidia bacterium]|nr:isoprenyl transferase [Bacteroidia bacterium]MBP9688283.1 isoprenyl transferase [Bacteroidia bacterium]